MVANMLRQATDIDPSEPWPQIPFVLSIEAINGVSGRLHLGERRAANDLAAALFILLLIFAWSCAKRCANNGVPVVFLCKITGANFSEAAAVYPACLLASLAIHHLLQAVPNQSPPHI